MEMLQKIRSKIFLYKQRLAPHKTLIIGSLVAVLVILISTISFVSFREDAPSRALNPFVDSSDEVKNCIIEAIGQKNYDEITQDKPRRPTDEESKATGDCAEQLANSDTSYETTDKNDGTAGPAASPQESSAPQATAPVDPELGKLTYAKTIINDQPIELSGNQVLEIIDTHYVTKNNIRLRDNATLIIRNSLFEHQKDYTFQYSLEAYDNSRVIVENSQIANACTGSLNWNFFGNSSLAANGVKQKGCNIWVLTTNSANTSIKEWDYFGGTTCDTARLVVENSKNLEIELCNAQGADMDIELPVVIDEYEFSGRTISGMKNSIILRNVTIDGWGVGASYGDNITVRNGHFVTISFGVGSPYQGKTVVLDDLGKKLYADRTWSMEEGSIRLINTNIYGWETSAWAGGHTLTIRNSDFTGPTLNSGNSKIVVENSKLDNANSFELVEMTIRDSLVRGQVVAHDNSVITLINTVVEGEIVEEGNGRVIRQ